MTDQSPTTTRFVALLAMTAIFAGLWANDGPRRPAMKPVSKIAPASSGEAKEAVASDTPASATSTFEIAGTVKSVAVESEHLNLSQQDLANHLGQLPMGLPAGDYRIVDSLGGVGWLRIRISAPGSIESATSPLLTTSVGEDQLRYIRVRETRTAGIEGPITR